MEDPVILSDKIKKLVMDQEGWTRKMFEAGIRMKKDYGVENVYDFSLGNPEIEPPSGLKSRLIELLDDPAPGMHRYMPNNGYEQVREEIAAYLSGRCGLPFTALHVFMTVGCAGGLNILFKAMLNEGDEVILPSPFFWEFKNYIENFGAIPKIVDTKEDFQLDMGSYRGCNHREDQGHTDQQSQQSHGRRLQRGKPERAGGPPLQGKAQRAGDLHSCRRGVQKARVLRCAPP